MMTCLYILFKMLYLLEEAFNIEDSVYERRNYEKIVSIVWSIKTWNRQLLCSVDFYVHSIYIYMGTSRYWLLTYKYANFKQITFEMDFLISNYKKVILVSTRVWSCYSCFFSLKTVKLIISVDWKVLKKLCFLTEI